MSKNTNKKPHQAAWLETAYSLKLAARQLSLDAGPAGTL